MPLLQTISPVTTVSEQIVEFNSSGSFTVPANVYSIDILGCGGGGGSGGGASTGNGGNGGSGKIIVKYLA
jgi:hypothetical protein